MKKLFLLVLLVSQSVFGVTENFVWRVPDGAFLPTWGILEPQSLPPLNLVVGGSSGGHNVTTNTPSWENIPGASFVITTNGRPVMILTKGGYVQPIRTSTGDAGGAVRVTRDGGGIGSAHSIRCDGTKGPGPFDAVACSESSFTWIDETLSVAGTYTYQLQGQKEVATTGMNVNTITLLGYEM